MQTEGDEDEETRWANWTMQDGYKQPPNLDSLHSTREMPLRAIAPGLHMGLSVLLDVQEEEYYCSGTESVGFKVSFSLSRGKKRSLSHILTPPGSPSHTHHPARDD